MPQIHNLELALVPFGQLLEMEKPFTSDENETARHFTTINSSSSGIRNGNSKLAKTKEEHSVDNDSTSTAVTEYSTEYESEVEQYLHELARSRRQCSLSDARIALSYVKGKLKEQEKASDDCTIIHSKDSSKTYSSFSRPERSLVRHRLEILRKDNNKFNIYASDVDFVERPVSISLIEDASSLKVVPVNADNDCQGRSLSKTIVPQAPPLKPPPLQVHTAVSPKRLLDHSSLSTQDDYEEDDEVSHVTHVYTEITPSAVDFEDSDDCCGSLSHDNV
eukprot:CAMPEP_0183732914 /NCGR_PEP_ID=MMETSP0737-20130205/39696_1 /TAXON_ID=385413 /ORGANISM="Thalassiosira miniscula, Strain CCMP1093" /LENGTH=276 /DNA_ID=CAMNT_0025966055 /DNA_START=88 /DNA_END=918 /DNA_ORIENTATION=+